jgi:hypothetical protein
MVQSKIKKSERERQRERQTDRQTEAKERCLTETWWGEPLRYNVE